MARRRSKRRAFRLLLAGLALAAFAVWLGFIGPRAWEAGQLAASIIRGHSETRVARLDHPLMRTADGLALAGQAPADYPSDLYLPPDTDLAGLGDGAGILLVPGASPGGKDEPLLVAFAEMLAAAGYAVLVPDLPGLRQQQVDPAHAADIGWAAGYLSALLDGRPVAVAAISYAVGPAVLAAEAQDGAAPIALILGIGGYYDAVATTTFVTTGRIRDPSGAWVAREPNAYGKWVFVWSNLPRIAAHADRARLEIMLRRKFDDPAAPVDDLAAELGPEGAAVWKLVANQDPDRVGQLIRMQPAAIRQALEGLDLARRDLSRLGAALLLVHGADDPILPPEGSVALAAAVPEAELHLLDSLAHVELSPASLADAWRLYRICWSLIRWRDRLASGA